MSDDPYLYILDMGSFYLKDKIPTHAVKIGTTWKPALRKLNFMTAHPTQPKYLALFLLDKRQFAKQTDLFKLDNAKFPLFLQNLGKRYLHIQQGSGTEWYWNIEDLIPIVEDFLKREKIHYRLIKDDPYPNTRFMLWKETQSLLSEDFGKMFGDPNLYSEYHKKEFLELVVPGRKFRSIQNDLWDLFVTLIRNNTFPIKGIMQWPTGVGKTIAILMMIVIAKKFKFFQEPIHALIVAPKNDIFESVKSQFLLLENYGIKILEGYDSRLSTIKYPNCDWILLATHAGLVNETENHRRFDELPAINFFLYDEVHRATGEIMFDFIIRKTKEWNTPFILGTSATPLTSNVSQHAKIKQIFGDKPLQRCDYISAIKNKWIAKPFFNFYVHSGSFDDIYEYMGSQISALIEKRRIEKMWHGGKIICYIPSKISECERALDIVSKSVPHDYNLYSANEVNKIFKTDKDFISAHFKNSPHILFTCQKYREGSDIKGIEMNNIVVGNSIEPYILVQIAGRALRYEYENKEGWCNIFKKTSKETETAEQALYDIFKRLSDDYDLFSIDHDKKELPNIQQISHIIREYIGEIKIDTKTYDKDKAINIINRLYTREHLNKINYEYCREINSTLGLKTKYEFFELFKSGNYPVDLDNDPNLKFKDKWVSWYDFMAVDVSKYPRDIDEWVKICKANGVSDEQSYNKLLLKNNNLPPSPSEMYDTKFSNYRYHFPINDANVEIEW